MKCLFRFDAGPEVGGGHAVRCIALARALERVGASVAFAVAGIGAARKLGLTPEDEVIDLDGAAADAPIAVEGHFDWAVVDHYGLGIGFERALRRVAARILVIDDLAERVHDCDLLLDQAPGRTAEDYHGLVPPDCRLLVGGEFALLRREFLAARARRASGSGMARVVVSLGASDAGGFCLRALAALERSPLRVPVDFVLAGFSPQRQALADAIAASPVDARLVLDATDVVGLLPENTVAIGAGGVSALERCCLGVPTIAVMVAENQRANIMGLARLGAVMVADPQRADFVDTLAATLATLEGDGDGRRAMAAAALRVCDGLGANRVAAAMLPAVVAKDGGAVTLRRADRRDEDCIYAWQTDPVTRRFSRNPQPPTPEEHHRWMAARLADPASVLTVVQHAGADVGILRFDFRVAVDAWEISILIDPRRHGLGIGRAALQAGRRLMAGENLVATVLPGNAPSHAAFRAAGFEWRGDQYVWA